MTRYTRYRMEKAYEAPMQKLEKATSLVAHGDFSVYVPTMNTPDKWDYLDVMIMDFNKMVEELGSMETMKTDFFPMCPMSLRQNRLSSRYPKDMTYAGSLVTVRCSLRINGRKSSLNLKQRWKNG
ncbi:MAG: hypothetical protein Q4C91_18235 [Eubacteriales bacterium]|nr:hypothetical protein [Eubacteriales bacterium]